MAVRAIIEAWTCQRWALNGQRSINAPLAAIQAVVPRICFFQIQHLAQLLRFLTRACLSISVREHILFPVKILVLLNWMKIQSWQSKHSQTVPLLLDDQSAQVLHPFLVLDEKGLNCLDLYLSFKLVFDSETPASANALDKWSNSVAS